MTCVAGLHEWGEASDGASHKCLGRCGRRSHQWQSRQQGFRTAETRVHVKQGRFRAAVTPASRDARQLLEKRVSLPARSLQYSNNTSRPYAHRLHRKASQQRLTYQDDATNSAMAIPRPLTLSSLSRLSRRRLPIQPGTRSSSHHGLKLAVSIVRSYGGRSSLRRMPDEFTLPRHETSQFQIPSRRY